MNLTEHPIFLAISRNTLMSVDGSKPMKFRVDDSVERAKEELRTGGFSFYAWRFVIAICSDEYSILLTQILDSKATGKRDTFAFHALGDDYVIEFSND